MFRYGFIALLLSLVACSSGSSSISDPSGGGDGGGDSLAEIVEPPDRQPVPDQHQPADFEAEKDGRREIEPPEDLSSGDLAPQLDLSAPGICNSKTGLTSPLPVCSTDKPCYAALVGKYNGFHYETISSPSTPPECVTHNPGRPNYDDSPPISGKDSAGLTRYACRYVPPGTDSQKPRPLVLWFHGAGGDADHLYDLTNLRTKAQDFQLHSDGTRPGFMLIAVQARNLHLPTIGSPGRHFDHFHRGLEGNPDVAFVDQLIDTQVASGQVDPKRIYLVGWSRGAFFAQFYGIYRRSKPTPAGNRVAAAAVYAAGDPLNNIGWLRSPSCQLDPYPTTDLPLYILNRACDALAACNATQQTLFVLPPGHNLSDWLDRLAGPMQNSNLKRVLIDSLGQVVSTCSTLCTQALGIANHARWPDGQTGIDKKDWEVELLSFLKKQALP